MLAEASNINFYYVRTEQSIEIVYYTYTTHKMYDECVSRAPSSIRKIWQPLSQPSYVFGVKHMMGQGLGAYVYYISIYFILEFRLPNVDS